MDAWCLEAYVGVGCAMLDYHIETRWNAGITGVRKEI
jgi:hypothetical protein